MKTSQFRKLILIAMLISIGYLTAQTFEYSFVSSMGTYESITGGVLLGTETSDDQRFVDPDIPAGSSTTTGPGLPIGFNFTFNDVVFDRLAINNNGWISLGQSALTPSVNNASTSGYIPLASAVVITPELLYNRISAMGRDLQAQAGASLRLETIGTAPNRVCVVQWANYKKYGTNGTGDSYNFQIRLVETSNQVQLVYGAFTTNATPNNFQVGLRGPLATDFNARTTATDWTQTTAATANTEYCIINQTVFPPNGLTFSFNYPVANQPPNPANLVYPANTATLISPFMVARWASGGGLPTGYKISMGTDNPPTNIANNIDLANIQQYDPPGELAYNTTYYWKVVPYNTFGDATNCPVWSFTTHGDASITTLPYTQNFDAVTAPDLPFDWTGVILPASTTAAVVTYATSPYSTPNCARIYSGSTTGVDVMLVGPVLHQSIPVNTTRLKFWLKGGSSTYTLQVGVIANPQDPLTFTPIETITTPTTWTEYIVPLNSYTGAGQTIAFRHGFGSTSQAIYVDDVSLELIAENDLACTSITGNTTPSVDSPVTYQANIFNWGFVSQSTYTVKLYNADDVELATAAGITCAPGATVQVPLTWTPTVEGPVSIYAKVILPGDQNTTNDQSPSLNVLVMGAGALVVSIGDGTSVNTITGYPTPYGTYYKNFHQQYLYTAAELTTAGASAGLITALAFNVQNVNNCSPMPNYTMKIKHTTQTTLTTTFEVGDYQQVWFQNDFVPVGGWNTHPFTTPFVWDGVSNILVDIITTLIPGAYTQNAQVYYTATTGTNTSLRYQSDSADAAGSLTGTTSVNRANIRFTLNMDGTGSLEGIVTSGGNPVDGVLININDTVFQQTTDATGHYQFPFLQPGNYTITASKLGYETQTLPAVIVADQATTLNINLIASSVVNVTGTVVGSDSPTVGLPDATILLEGVLEYSATTNAHGQFTVTGVLSGNAYNYTITRAGYQPGVGTITVGAGNYNMGTVILNELTLPPVQVLAELNPPETAITLTWRPPGSTGGAEDEDFELSNGEWVPSSNWTNPLGDWEWTDEYDIADWSPVYTGTSVIPPPTAHSGTGMWGTKINTNYTNSGGFSYLTKTIDFTGFTNTTMRFWSWENLFGDWDYAQVRVNGTLVWGPSWDYTGTQWRERIINLSAFDGMADVTVVFEMFATTTVNYAGWYIDDLFIGSGDAIAQTSPASIMPAHLRTLNESEAAVIAENLAQKAPQPTLRSAAQAYSNSSRLPVGYKVWRLLQGNEQNEATWTLLTPTVIIDTFFVMQGWQGIPDGHYRWAVKTVYTNDVLSNPAFSNMIRKRPNDLSALSINGSTTPSVGILNTYNITIKNTGTAAQTAGAYSVKLMSGTTELGTTTGPALAVDEEAIVAVTWTPATPGPMALFGKTVHAGDTDPTNDSSPELNISVMPAGVIAVTVGEGNQTDGKPFEFLNNNSLYQCLYYPSELGRFGNITALSFYNNFTTNFVNKPIKIWLGTTQLNDLSGGWILPATNLTLVYDGTANFPSGANTITIPLQTQFQYTSGNLVLYANRPMDTTIGVAADDFLVQTVGSNRARKLSSNTVTYDPESPSATGTLSGQFPKATFHMTSIGTTPLYAVTPSGRNFGTVLIESVNNQTFTVTNAGGAPLTVSTISISGSPHFTLQDMPTLPASLEFGEAITFVGRYNPTAEGTHAATITINDNMTRLPHNIELNGTCIDTQINTLPYVQNFDTVTTPNLPPDWNSYVQATVTTAYVQTYTTTPHSTPNTAGLANSSDANATLLLIAPPYANTIPTNTTRVKFWGRSSSANYTVMVGVMTDYQDPATFTSVQTIALTTTWTEYVVTFAGYTGTGRTVAFKHGLGGTTRTIYIDDVMLEVIPQNDLAALSILGNSTPTVGIPSNYTVNVFNWGSNPQTTYQVKLFKEGDVEVGSVDGPTINPGITQGVVVPWTPDTQGATSIYGKVVLTGDQNNLNDQTSNMGVFVQPPGTLAFTVGVGDQTARIPLDMFYKNSMHQYIIYPAEIGNTIGQIFGISLYNQFTQDLNLPIKVWIGTTTQTDLSAGWIPVTNHSLVYDANLQFPTGENTLTITFNAPYLYLTGENLVITFNRPMDTQYYSSTNYFKAQTGTELRARNIYSDSTTYDPANPPTTGGTNSAQFPKTTLLIIPGGVGHLNGTVLGVGNQPLEGVHVQLAPGGYQTTTNAQGQYQIMNILPNDYAVTFSRWGYLDSVQNVTIEEDETETLNVTMTQMPTVSVTGTINASDTGAGINGAGIHLVGYDNYTVATNTQGEFTIAGVYTDQSYEYTIVAAGYQNAEGTINVGATNYSMGTIVLNEVAYAPRQVQAEINDTNTATTVSWQPPDPTALDLSQGFEETPFPSNDWTQVITNTGEANTSGVFPTWCNFGSITISGIPTGPHEGNYQAGLWWSYDHQDEWLITPLFNCPPSAYLRFWSHVFYGSDNGDHYYIKISTNGGTSWSVLWDASAQTGGWNSYASPITLDLSMYEGLQVKLAWHAEDPASNDGLWYVWFIDDVYIGNEVTAVAFEPAEYETRSASGNGFRLGTLPTTNPSRAVELGMKPVDKTRNHTQTRTNNPSRATEINSRSLVGYKIWRFAAGNENNEPAWTLLTDDIHTEEEYTDSGWVSLANGTYRYAVKAVYTSDVLSVPSFSNPLIKEVVTGMIAGVVRRTTNQAIPGATVTAGTYSATTNTAGAYSIVLPIGVYTVTATHPNFLPQSQEETSVLANQTTTVNFILVGVDNEDDTLPVVATALNGNYPNPFNPETTISFAVKEAAAVKLDIYNLKGQLIRSLVHEDKAPGHYRVVWNGKDNQGFSVGSGVYFYRMTAGAYSSTKKMLLME